MYNGLVKDLLKKHYGEPKGSLYVGADDEPGERVYYYVLKREKEVAAVRALLDRKDLAEGIEKIPELKQSFDDDGDDGLEHRQCVQYIEKDGHWTAYFFTIKGVNYRRTYGNRVAAVLQLSDYPFVTLSDGDAQYLYGFWKKARYKKGAPSRNREGLSYWMNKALWTNGRFRDFAVDFIISVAEAERRFILKDAARTIANCHCFLLPISFQELIRFRTPSALIKNFLAEDTDINVDFNKTDVNVAYVMALLAPEVEKKDWKLVSKLDVHTLSETITLKTFYHGFNVKDFVVRYYEKKLGGGGNEPDIAWCAEDYVEMSFEASEPIRLGFGSLEALRRAHDELSFRNRMKAMKSELELPLVTVPSKFDELEAAVKSMCPNGFERICTTERLFKEGSYQHNCVFSRRELIRKDRASVYHWDHDDSSYTIQFSRDRRGRYSLDEVRARFNEPISEDHFDHLAQLLKGFCSVDRSVIGTYRGQNILQGRDPLLRDMDWGAQILQEPDEIDVPF